MTWDRRFGKKGGYDEQTMRGEQDEEHSIDSDCSCTGRGPGSIEEGSGRLDTCDLSTALRRRV
jgi:hypothetical protein